MKARGRPHLPVYTSVWFYNQTSTIHFHAHADADIRLKHHMKLDLSDEKINMHNIEEHVACIQNTKIYCHITMFTVYHSHTHAPPTPTHEVIKNLLSRKCVYNLSLSHSSNQHPYT